jgi:hypothetical protein
LLSNTANLAITGKEKVPSQNPTSISVAAASQATSQFSLHPNLQSSIQQFTYPNSSTLGIVSLSLTNPLTLKQTMSSASLSLGFSSSSATKDNMNSNNTANGGSNTSNGERGGGGASGIGSGDW